MAELPDHMALRIAQTTAVRDTDAIPKVEGAGEVREHDGGRVQVMHNGVLIEEGCYHGEMMTQIIRELRGHHEPQEEAVFHAIVERLASEQRESAPAMLELGAFWAYYSMWFNRALPGATNVMVEPDPVNVETGRRNFALNGMEGRFVQAAVGAAHGEHVWLPCESDWKVRRLPTVTIDGLLRDHGVDRFDLVLCDTQGAELEVLRAAREAIAGGRVRFLVISTHHWTISGDPLTHQKCLEELTRMGCHIIAEHSVAEGCSGDGLIAASADPRDADFTVPVSHVRAKDSVYGELEYDLARARSWPGAVRLTGKRAADRVRNYVRRVR